jgi:hypothetical protein
VTLAELLSTSVPEHLERLSQEHIRPEAPLSRATLCSNLEGTLRSYRLVQEVVLRRQPPAFSILSTLLEAPDHSLAIMSLRDAVTRHVDELCAHVTSGEILGREDQLQLYRRVLYEARRSDLQIDVSESTLLGVLRRELGIAHVEHFLIEYHSDLQEFWHRPDSFNHELHGLVCIGLLFVSETGIVMAADVAPLVRQALGLDMSPEAARRLYGALPSSEIADALARIDVRTSGSKEERVERLLLNRVQPRSVLRRLPLQALRDLARDAGAVAYGNKDDLVERIVTQYAAGSDQALQEVPAAPPILEDRTLDEQKFGLLFASLKGAELTQILWALPDLKQSGTKEVRTKTLWQSHRAESTLLGFLRNRDIEDILSRFELRIGGSKPDRIQRLVDYFAGLDPESLVALSRKVEDSTDAGADPTSAAEEGSPTADSRKAD